MVWSVSVFFVFGCALFWVRIVLGGDIAAWGEAFEDYTTNDLRS
jgi:hypothetical protein